MENILRGIAQLYQPPLENHFNRMFGFAACKFEAALSIDVLKYTVYCDDVSLSFATFVRDEADRGCSREALGLHGGFSPIQEEAAAQITVCE